MGIGRIVWKNFWGNIRSFLAFFISVVISVSTVFLFIYVREAGRGIEKTGLFFYQKYSWFGETITQYTAGVVVVAIIVILYSVQIYIRSRIKDYGMLYILGIRGKDMKKCLLLEYGIGCIVSCAVGIVVGNVLSIFLGKSMDFIMGQNLSASVSMQGVYQWTFGVCAIMMMTALVILMIRLAERNMSQILNEKERKEKRTTSKWSLLGLIAGLGLIILTNVLVINVLDPELVQYIQFILFVGLFLVLSLGTGFLFETYRKSKGYYKKILVWNEFYHYFNRNKNMIFIQTALGIFLLNFCWSMLTSALPFRQYVCPNDFICISENGENFSEEIENNYHGEVDQFPFVIVSRTWGGASVGMSAADYQRIFGERIALKEDEIMSVTENMMSSEYEVGDSAGKLHLGKDIDMSGEDMSTAMSGDTTFTVKEERELEYLGLGFDSFIVFPDATFQKAVEKDKFQKDMMVIRVLKDELKDVTQYIQGQKEKGVLEEAFSKKTYLDNARKEEVLYLVMGVVLGIAVLFLGMFVLWLKIYAESRQLNDKYQMLHALGMKQRELRKTLRKEISLIITVPMLLTTALTVIFILGRMYAYAPEGQSLFLTLKINNVGRWLLEGVTLTYLFFELIFMLLVQVWSGKKIWMLK